MEEGQPREKVGCRRVSSLPAQRKGNQLHEKSYGFFQEAEPRRGHIARVSHHPKKRPSKIGQNSHSIIAGMDQNTIVDLVDHHNDSGMESPVSCRLDSSSREGTNQS